MLEEISPICRENILVLAFAYRDLVGTTTQNVSRLCHSDPPFLENLKKKKVSVTVRKYDSIIKWFDQNWPLDQPKPEIRKVFMPAIKATK